MANLEIQARELAKMSVTELRCSNCHHALKTDINGRFYCIFNQTVEQFPSDGQFDLVDGSRMNILPRIIDGMRDPDREIACDAIDIIPFDPTDNLLIDSLGLTILSSGPLKRAGITKIGVLCTYREVDLRNIPNLSSDGAQEILKSLAKM